MRPPWRQREWILLQPTVLKISDDNLVTKYMLNHGTRHAGFSRYPMSNKRMFIRDDEPSKCDVSRVSRWLTSFGITQEHYMPTKAEREEEWPVNENE